MKSSILSLVLLSLLSGPAALAQTTSTTRAQVDEGSGASDHGLRVTLVRPILKVKVKADNGNSSDSESLDNAYGLGVGYSYLPIGSLGFIGQLTFMEIKEEDDSVGLGRVEANLAGALNRHFHIKGGLNASHFTRGNPKAQTDMGFGFQLGVGLQVNRHLGFDVSYLQMQQEFERSDVSLIESGVEIGVTGTF